jgi:riboflavin biosynthesis pyrimidine reductase
LRAIESAPHEQPLELLFERGGLPSLALPEALVARYGGPLGFATPRVIANFVASIDGVVTLAGAGESGRVISGGSDADRFVMGLLRSCVDAIVVGAETFRKDAGRRWTPAAIYPMGADAFDEARRRLDLSARPTLVVVTASGSIDPGHPALPEAVIVTTSRGASILRHRVPSTTRIVAFEASPIPVAALFARLRAEGLGTILTEGGPSLLSNLLKHKVVDELFLTLSPTLFGRTPNDRRKSLAEGHDLAGLPLGLLSARRHGSYLFLRYAVGPYA